MAIKGPAVQVRSVNSGTRRDRSLTLRFTHLLLPEPPRETWGLLRKARADFCSSLS